LPGGVKWFDRWRAVKVHAVSVDETIAVQLTGTGEATVEFAGIGFSRHTGTSLERAVPEAVIRALTVVRRWSEWCWTRCGIAPATRPG